jgi:hypothetical protein
VRVVVQVTAWKRQHRLRRKDFDQSVKRTKEEIRARGQLLLQWVQRQIDKKVASVDRFAAEKGRREMTR